MKLDRAIQLQLLKQLASVYPNSDFHVIENVGCDYEVGIANMAYLAEHKLVFAKFIKHSDGVDFSNSPQITASGLDFLADDGGLTAIRGVVTVRFHEDTLKDLIELRLSEAPIPSEEKNRLLQSVRELPADSIKHLTTRLLDLGMDNLPRAVELIRTVLT